MSEKKKLGSIFSKYGFLSGIEDETPEKKSEPARRGRANRNRDQGDQNEDDLARITGLRKTAGSGCGLIEKGDLGAGSPILLEAKSTRADMIRIQLSWIEKLSRYLAADPTKRLWLLQIAFVDRHVSKEEFPDLRFIVCAREEYGTYFGETLPEAPSRMFAQSYPLSQKGAYKPPFMFFLGSNLLTIFPESWLTPAVINRMEKKLEQ